MSENFKPFRHRIQILKKTESQNSFGEVLVEWSHHCEIWGEIHGDTVTTRYLADVVPGWRAVIGKTIFEIVAVIDRPGKTRLVELRLKEVLPGRGGHAPGAMAMDS